MVPEKFLLEKMINRSQGVVQKELYHAKRDEEIHLPTIGESCHRVSRVFLFAVVVAVTTVYRSSQRLLPQTRRKLLVNQEPYDHDLRRERDAQFQFAIRLSTLDAQEGPFSRPSPTSWSASTSSIKRRISPRRGKGHGGMFSRSVLPWVVCSFRQSGGARNAAYAG